MVKILKLKFRQHFEAEDSSVFCCRGLVEVTKLNFGQGSEARFGQDIQRPKSEQQNTPKRSPSVARLNKDNPA